MLKKRIIGLIVLIFIMVFVIWYLKKNEIKLNDEINLNVEEKNIVNKFQSYSDTLNILENLYDREQNEIVMTVENNHLEIQGGSEENFTESEEEIKKFFNDLECISIRIEIEDGIKFMRIALQDRKLGEDGIYYPVFHYCLEQEKYMEYYGISMSEHYGEEFRKGWYYRADYLVG